MEMQLKENVYDSQTEFSIEKIYVTVTLEIDSIFTWKPIQNECKPSYTQSNRVMILPSKHTLQVEHSM